jgi:Protein of unknown function (DUF2911)
MKHLLLRAALVACLLCAPLAFAQDNDKSADCTFNDGKQLSIRYTDVAAKKSPAPGKVWSPGKAPMTLFTQTDLTLGDSTIPAAAYTVYLLPGTEQWTLVVNKNVQPGTSYDKSQDVARVQMPVAELGSPTDKLKLTLAKMGDKQCNLRVYYAKTGTYGAEFKEK